MNPGELAPGKGCRADSLHAFEQDLRALINKHSIENELDMPDYLLANMICRIIGAIGPCSKANLDWHGCNSVCHPVVAVEVEAP